jgi:hypothetical protein
MRTITLSFFTLILSISGFGRNAAYSIKGKIADAGNAAIEFANIFLLRTDSAFVKGTNSDSEGQFMLTNVIPDRYIIKITSLGYLDTYINLPEITQNTDLGLLTINDNTQVLQEVVVTSDKIIEKNNRQILFPDAIQIKTSTQGFDLLGKMQIPEIIVDGVTRTVSALDGGWSPVENQRRKSGN